MTINEINSFLLSTLARNTRFGCDIKAIQKRYQVLSIIYINFSIAFLITGYETAIAIIGKPPFPFVLTLMYAPLFFLSFLFIHKQKFEHAALVLMLYMHLIDGAVAYIGKGPMTGLTGLMVIVSSVFFITSSKKVRTLDTIICIIQAFWEGWLTFQAFEVTLTEDQAYHIFSYVIGTLFLIASTIISCNIQKTIETNLWQMIISIKL
jgi:hypothetical protein